MSAVWGIIDWSKSGIQETEMNVMRDSYSKCVIDRFEENSEENVYMGCGIQYVTKEAYLESLPSMEPGKGYYFDADVILDNRKELCDKLNIRDVDTVADGTILAEMFHRYGFNCLNILLGAYAFVYYDRLNRQVELVVDAMGNRCLYYRVYKNRLYFSSLLEPLILIDKEAELNERWFSDFLGLENLLLFTETEETPISGIYRVAPGQIVTVSEIGIKKQTYWNPLEQFKELRLQDDQAYAEKFRELFQEAVSCVLRTDQKKGILLSGGLDSSAVASVAAPILKTNGETLYAYTSVPEAGYQSTFPESFITDESEQVKKTKEFLGNLECSFIDMPHVNPWDSREVLQNCHEMPYKNVLNLLWMHEAMKQAANNKIRVMLTGSYGNSSISFSNLELYISTLFSDKHFIKFWRELSRFQKVYGFSRKYALKKTIRQLFGGQNITIQNDKDSSYLKEMMWQKFNTEKRLSDMYVTLNSNRRNFKKYRKMLCNLTNFRQIGEAETKLSLFTGVILRDPTKDKRVVEFCLHLPLEQFIKEGYERRLVNVYLADIMPKHLINVGSQGRQSADLVYRIQKQWKHIKEDWLELYKKHIDNSLIDCEKAIRDIENKSNIEEYKEYDLVRHIYTVSVLEYIDYIKRLAGNV